MSSPPITEANEEAELTSGCKRVNVFAGESGSKAEVSECPDPSEPCNVARIEAITDDSLTQDSPTVRITQKSYINIE